MQRSLADTDAHPAAATADGLPSPRRYWSAATIWLAMSMSVLDGAIANVALPTIARELHAAPAASIWIVNAYQLAITVTLLPLAALGDKLGYRRVYMAGLAVFTLGSLGCALSHTLAELTAARILQGLGAGGIMSINSALVRFTYPKRLLGHGIGLNAVVISISADRARPLGGGDRLADDALAAGRGARRAGRRAPRRPLSGGPAGRDRTGDLRHRPRLPVADPSRRQRRADRLAHGALRPGLRFFQSPNNRAMVSSAPLHRSGAAGGMLATARLLGQTAGAASVGVFFHLAGTHATTAALMAAAGVAALAAGVSLLRLRIAPPAPETRPAEARS